MKLFLAGYFGAGNFGDEALLAAFCLRMRQFFPELKTAILSRDPAWSAAKHDASGIGRKDIARLAAAISSSDAVVFPGGSVLQDKTSSRSLFYYGMIIETARALGKPVYFCFQGVGPLKGQRGRKMVCRWLSKADFVGLRDDRSADLIREIGANAARIGVAGDPVLLYPEDLGALPPAAAPEKGDCFGLSLKPDAGALAVAREIDAWLLEGKCGFGGKALRFIFHEGQDEADWETGDFKAEYETIFWQKDEAPSFNEMAKVFLRNFSGCRLFVGMRLHSLVCAAALAIPFLALSYDPKVAAFAEMMGQPCLEMSGIEAKKGLVGGALSRFAADAAALRESLLMRRSEAVKRVETEFERIAERLKFGGID